jgi:fibronectin type 3 domain-containing protein
VTAARSSAEAQLRAATTKTTTLTINEIAALGAGIDNLLAVLRRADPTDKTTVYANTTDSNGHYSAVANAAVYYLANMYGVVSPGGTAYLFPTTSTVPHFDLTNADLTQDFQLPTTTLTLTVKDGFGNTVSGAPVNINTQGTFGLTPGEPADYYNNYPRTGTTNNQGTVSLSVFKTTYPAGSICATVSGNQICNSTTQTITGPANLLFQSAPQVPPAPTGLAGTTPTASPPALSWNAVTVAASYRVYRNGQQVGSTTTTSFTDSTLSSGGTYSYTVTSISALNIESSASSPFSVVYTTGPAVTNAAVSPSTVSVGQAATLTATVTDSVATVMAAEYFEGTDPGEGHGTPMTLSGSIITATLPTTLALGSHTFTVRAKDSLGAWTRGTLPTITLSVVLPTLTGRVLNGANQGLSGVRVDVVSPSDHSTVIATTTTGSNGNYSVTVQPGTYDVIYTPGGTTYQTVTKTGVNLTTSATVDVVLVLQPKTFSGYLTDRNHMAIPGAVVSLHNSGGQTYGTTTTATGFFSLDVNPASYSLTLSGTKANAPSALIPTSFTLSGGSFDLTADVPRNLEVDAATVTFVTTSKLTGNLVGGVGLGVSTSTTTTLYPGSAQYTGSASYSATTNEFGVASLVVLTGSLYSVTATPPAGSGVVATSFPTDGPIVDDTTVPLALTADIHRFTGTFTAGGTAIPGATVRLSGPLGTFQATTAADGKFAVDAAAGSYSVSVTGSRPAGVSIPDTFGFTGGSIDLSAENQDRILNLPATTVDVTAVSPFGTDLSGVGIQITGIAGPVVLFPGPGGSFTATASSTATTDSNGVARLYATTGLAYTTKATPAAGSGYSVTNLGSQGIVTGPTGWTIQVARDLKDISGVVSDANGHAVPGATVRLDGNEADQHYTIVTDNNGVYHLQVAPNSAYTMRVSGAQAASTNAYLPENFTLTTTISVTGTTTRNVTVTAVLLRILARDDRLAPVKDVGIAFTSTGSQNGFAASSSTISRTTGDDGRTELVMLAGTTYTITATPPAGIGYVTTTFNGTSPITQDSETIIEFQNHIPLIVTGVTAPSPTKTAPALTWNSVTNAHHYIVYRDGVAVATPAVTSCTDTALTADGRYDYRVSAVSADGYEGPKSTPPVTVVFDTTGPVVATPQFSVNPKRVGQSTVVTATATDAGSGVDSGEYFIGTDPGAGHGMSMGYVNGVLTGTIGPNLRPGTYQVSVRGRDTLGIWGAPTPAQLIVSRPAPPTNLTAPSPTNHDPVLTWTASPDAVAYAIYRDTTKLTDEPTGTTFTDTGRPDGLYQYTVQAINEYGDLSVDSNPATVLVDTRAPNIHHTVTPLPNSAGWNRSDLVVTFTCDDGVNGSGVAACPDPVTIDQETPGRDVTGTTTDAAGNMATDPVHVKLDKTTPGILATVFPPPNALGWNHTDVTVTFSCSDTLSGVQTCPASRTITDEGTTVVTGTAVDNADNTSSIDVTARIDKHKPTIHPIITPVPNTAGWHHSAVVVTFVCDDAGGSGVVSCTDPVTVTGQTAGQDIVGTAIDAAGNVESATVHVKLDTTAPTITATVAPPPNAAGWNRTDATVTFTCTDALSGVQSCPPPSTVSTEGTGSVSGTALDNADNAASASVTVRLDKSSPTLDPPVWATNPKPKDGTTTLSVGAHDVLSGVAGGEYYLDSDPGAGNGTAMTFANGNLTTTIGTSLAVGVYLVGIRARDTAGNWSATTTTMLVVFDPSIAVGITGKNHNDLVPSLANGDVLPGLTSAGQADTVDYGFTVDYSGGSLDPRNDFMLSYNTGSQCNSPHPQNCHTFTVSATSFDWMIIDQTNNSRGRFQGTATVTIDGITTTNPFTVEGIDGDRQTPTGDDQVVVKMYAPGANPTTATPIYQVSGSLTHGNAVRIR